LSSPPPGPAEGRPDDKLQRDPALLFKASIFAALTKRELDARVRGHDSNAPAIARAKKARPKPGFSQV